MLLKKVVGSSIPNPFVGVGKFNRKPKTKPNQMSFGFSVSVFRFSVSVSVSVSHTFRFSVSVSVFILVTLLVRLIGFRFRFSVFFVNFFEISQKNVKILISFGFYYSVSVFGFSVSVV